MTAQDDEKHYEQEETRAKTGTSKWTAEAIRDPRGRVAGHRERIR